MMKEEWLGPEPVSSTKSVMSRWRETDDDGSEWYVASDGTGNVVARILIRPLGARLSSMLLVQAAFEASLGVRQLKEQTFNALIEKRKAGLILTSDEIARLIDHLIGL